MVSEISLLGITFHLYGIILGMAVIVWVQLVSRQLEKYSQKVGKMFDEQRFFIVVFCMLICAVVGARLWHVLTDWPYYATNLSNILFIWNGGLSIFGALVGGFGFLLLSSKKRILKLPFLVLLDAIACALPFAQAIGRWANYINQELYGLPSELPWAIPIDPARRLVGYEHFETFHPLFLYESLGMFFLGVGLWRLRKKFSLGSGVFVGIYVMFYAIWRFFLDFLRIGVAEAGFGMSMNQLILLCGILLSGVTLYGKKETIRKKLLG